MVLQQEHIITFTYYHINALSLHFISNNVKVLYISYDGMTDPLGASQVMPYLCGLAANGHSICLMSFEKQGRYEKGKQGVSAILDAAGIKWFPLSYTSKPPVISTLRDVRTAKKNRNVYHSGSANSDDTLSQLHCRPGRIAFSKKEKYSFSF